MYLLIFWAALAVDVSTYWKLISLFFSSVQMCALNSSISRMIGAHSFGHDDHGIVGLPYNMEYALPSHNYHTTAELNGGDLFSMPLQQSAQESLAAAAGQPAQAASFASAEAIPAESQLNPVVASLTAQQKAQMSQPLLSAQGAPKVKRQDDIWTGNFEISIWPHFNISLINFYRFDKIKLGYLKKPMFYNGVGSSNQMYFQG